MKNIGNYCFEILHNNLVNSFCYKKFLQQTIIIKKEKIIFLNLFLHLHILLNKYYINVHK